VIIAKEGINSIQDLKGKSVGLEKGLVDHLLLATALSDQKMSINDVKLVNSATNQLPQVFTSREVSELQFGNLLQVKHLNLFQVQNYLYRKINRSDLRYFVSQHEPFVCTQRGMEKNSASVGQNGEIYQ
jgi:NitT/TauT family transport system substrate-binding protein